MATSTDILIIGSGIAGLSLALDLADRARVTVITKRAADRGSTAWAQGGVSAVHAPDDSVELHVQDTLTAGDGLCDEAVVREVCAAAPGVIRRLQERGVRFTRSKEGGLELGREGGHSRRRVVHADDLTGAAIERALLAAVAAHPSVTLLENHFAVDLILSRRLEPGLTETPSCRGAWVLDGKRQGIEAIAARVTVLATGGAGKVYVYTTNDDVSTGDGLAMAWRAGCRVSNLEFYQFHPTCLFHPYAKSFLVSEAVRGEGGVLVAPDGRRIMEGRHPQADLAPRDIVAREIDRTMKETGADHVWLDITHRDAGFLRQRFPTIHARCLELGIDMTKEPIPVVPASHYQCGGVMADLSGRTDVPGLLAIGEVACTGLHGANRLASNSLLEGAVMASRAAGAALEILAGTPEGGPPVPEWDKGAAIPSDETVVVTQSWEEIRRFMWNYVGIVRSDTRLQRARRRIELTEAEIREFYWRFIVTPDLLELRNLAIVARLVIDSALWRKESRGLHATTTWPERSEAFRRPSILHRRASWEASQML